MGDNGFDDSSWKQAAHWPVGVEPWTNPERATPASGGPNRRSIATLFAGQSTRRISARRRLSQLSSAPEKPTVSKNRESSLRPNYHDRIRLRSEVRISEITANAESDGVVLDLDMGRHGKDGHVSVRRQGNPSCDR